MCPCYIKSATFFAWHCTQDIEINSIDDSEPDNNDILKLISKSQADPVKAVSEKMRRTFGALGLKLLSF